jgi:8-oxo-dGTP diphosphatase
VNARVRGLEEYPKPSLAVDPALLTVEGDQLWAVLWRRQHPPQKGSWGLPGVFVKEGEQLESAVRRALREKTNVAQVSHVEQLFTWNKPGRDPRGWVVTVAYFALLSHESVHVAVAGRHDVALFRVSADGDGNGSTGPVMAADGRAVRLAFDHADIIRLVVIRLRERLWHTSVALALLPDRFTLRDMQLVYEAIMGQKLNKDSFRRRVTKTQNIVMPTGDLQSDVDHRPAELFTRAACSG